MAIHKISICLSDVDEDRLQEDKNGKIWLSVTIFESRQYVKLQDNLEVFQTATVEQQKAGIPQQRLGRGRTVHSNK